MQVETAYRMAYFEGSNGVDRRFVATRWLLAAVILAASVILSIPLFRDGLPYAHDTEEHLERYICFTEQLSHGELYPRWLAKANGGLGSPVMFVYAPLAYYVPAALRPILRFPLDGATESREMAVSMWMALAVSGLAAFLWLQSVVKREKVAAFGALVYMGLPYHFLIDLYTRAAVSEMWAFAWMPLILYFTAMLARKRTMFGVAGLSVSYALLVFTHLLTTLIFTPVMAGVAVISLERGAGRAALVRIAVALFLGMSLSAAYWVPALHHEKTVSPDRMAEIRPTLAYPSNFIGLRRSWTEPGSRGDYVWKVSWLTLTTAAAAAAAFALRRFSPQRETTQDRFWALVAVVSVAMMFSISKFVWDSIPQLAPLQFPYRFNLLLCPATVALIASAADALGRPVRAVRITMVAAIAALMSVWVFTDLATVRHLSPGKLRSAPPMAQSPLVLDVLLPGWSQAKDAHYLRQPGILALSSEATIYGDALKSASLNRFSSRDLELVEEGSQGWVTLPLLYYPAWTAKTQDGRKVNLRAIPENGLLQVEAPAGRNRIELTMPADLTEKLGNGSTMISAAVVILILAAGFRQLGAKDRRKSGRLAVAASMP